jgi:hypothetical protein
MTGFCEYGDEPSGSEATELVNHVETTATYRTKRISRVEKNGVMYQKKGVTQDSYNNVIKINTAFLEGKWYNRSFP